MSKNLAIIFAGGSGARMGSGVPKQFIEVSGKPIIIYTLEVFEEHPDIDGIYVACKTGYIDHLKRLLRMYGIEKVRKVVEGGETGQGSIYNALIAAREENDDDSVVLIHDGVRPCIDSEIISKNIECHKANGSCVTCSSMYETPVISRDSMTVSDMPGKNGFYTAQAPQTFTLGEIIKAHEEQRAKDRAYTDVADSCTLMKNAGKKIAILTGPRGNIKVTTPEDIFLFKAMIEYKESESIFGFIPNEVETNLKK